MYAFAGVNRTLQELKFFNTEMAKFPKDAVKVRKGPEVIALRRTIAKAKQHLSVGWVTNIYFDLLRASEGTLSQSRLHLQSLAPTNPHWVRGGLWPSSLWVIHKEGLCPSSGDINRLMMINHFNSDGFGPMI
jgi:hypothetical protein